MMATVVFVLLVALALAVLGQAVPVDFAIALVIGWAFFLVKTLPQVRFDGYAVALAAIALALFAVGIDRCGRLLFREGGAVASGPSFCWTRRCTAATVLTLLVMFAAGIGVVGIAHQVGWLITSNEDLTASSFEAHLRVGSKNNLKQLGLGAYNYHEQFKSFPPGATFSRAGTALHSWQTLLLPGMEQQSLANQVSLSKPWNDPVNQNAFETVLPVFLNPGIGRNPTQSTERSLDGLALSHYAANGWILSGNAPLRREDITDGTQATIMAGEVNSNFKPWGNPTNWRDPAKGVNNSPDGFGSPFTGGAQFLLCDGAVRFVSNSIDPAVLKALSTPTGGESVSEY
jgi:hypothetical protein